MAARFAIDTNVLLRLSSRRDPYFELIEASLRSLVSRGTELCFTPQNLGEFWNVSTRPRERNGFGLSTEETDAHVRAIERVMTLLPDTDEVYKVWRRLLVAHEIRGVQVHDAHLAAALSVHNVHHLLTLNTADFKRYSNLEAIHPEEVQV